MSLFGLLSGIIYTSFNSLNLSSTGSVYGGISALLYTDKGGAIALIALLVVAAAVTAICSSLVSRISSSTDDD